jgi:hypothetical protein
LIELARQYEVAYTEIYPPDLLPLDTKHRIVEAFTFPALPPGTLSAEVPEGFIGFRCWLKRRARILYLREGTMCQRFASGDQPRKIAEVKITSSAPKDTWVKALVRVGLPGGSWSGWRELERLVELPAATEAEVQLTLHTDDGCLSPCVRQIAVQWEPENRPTKPGAR